MSSAARPVTPATGASVFSPPPPEAHQDPAPIAPEMREALRRDQLELQREVILWQRWVRYGAVVALATVALVFARPAGSVLVLLGGVAAAYLAVVAASAWAVRDASRVRGLLLPALLATADAAALAATFHLISPPADQDRLLVLGLLVVQLAVFYFGWRLATWAAALLATAFVLSSLVLEPIVTGPRPAVAEVGFALALFTGAAVVVIATFGRFRSRMNALRLYCKQVEENEGTAGALRLGEDRFPDGLTLVARSLEAMRGRLAEQIGTDPLTACLNRRALEVRLRNDWRLARRRGSHVAVLAIDLDHFKLINDTRGHPVGDLVLQQLAGIMKATARDTDAVARLGGDEFVIVLPDTAWQGAMTFGERLRRRVDDFTFGPANEPVALTISIGIALARGTDPISADVLLQEADRSLYKAKTGGRNQVFA